jgi:hypothetical protein
MEVLGQAADPSDERGRDLLRQASVAQAHEDDEAGLTLDQRADRRLAEPAKQ